MFEKCEKIMNCQTFICHSNLCLVECVSIFLLHKIEEFFERSTIFSQNALSDIEKVS